MFVCRRNKFKRKIGAVSILVVISFLGLTSCNQKKMSPEEELFADASKSLLESKTSEEECVALEKFKTISDKNKKAFIDIADMHVKGLCVPVDVDKAITIYKKADLSGHDLGKALYLAAQWENIPPSKISHDQRVYLFTKVKELGYQPTEDELAKLSPDYLFLFKEVNP